MNSSFLESLSAALSNRTNKGLTARKTSDWPRMQANRRHRFRLGPEPLEDRLVLSNLLVTSSLDLLNTPGTLRDAVNQANLDGAQGIGDSISFAPNLNGAHIFLQLGDLELTAGANLAIWATETASGPDANPLGTILNGDSDRIFQIDSGATLILDHVTLAGGTATNGDGGAINNAGSLTLQACTLTDNTATSNMGPYFGLGGAIYNTGTLTTSHTNTFSDNSALSGGAIANGPGGIASLENDVYSSIPATSNSPAIPGNSATQDGGAIYNAGNMTVYGCTLSGNKAEFGGGLFNDGGTVTLFTATIAGNTAAGSSAGSGQGGGLDNNGAMTLSFTTVSTNSANQGGGICNSDSLTLVNSIVAGNTLTYPTDPGPDVSGNVAADSAYDLIGDGTGLSGISNGVNSNQVGSSSAPINPLLAPLGNCGGLTETMPLQSGSPAIAAGGPCTTLTAGITAEDTVLNVADAAAFECTPLTFLPSFEIDDELMDVRSFNLANNTITVWGRGASPPYSAPSSHDAGAGLYYVFNGLSGTLPTTPPSLGAVQPLVASKVVFTTQPSNTAAGASITPPVQVTVEDASGNPVTTDNSNVTVSIGANPGNGTLGGTFTEAAVNGVATFSNLSIDEPGTGYTLTASDGDLSKATSGSFNIVQVASQLAFTTQPGNTMAGDTITPAVQVTVEDANGNVVLSDNSNVTVAIGSNPGSGMLSGTVTEPAVDGMATFSNLSINKAGTGYTLMASDGALDAVVSAGFNITPRLSNLVVNSSQDSITTPTGTLTLREAVNQADADGALGGVDTISFASSLNGDHILLQEGNLELTAGANVTIWGSGITLNGDSDNIFQVAPGASLLLNGLTMAGGTAANGNGGPINNAGTLTVQGCALTDNSATSTAVTGIRAWAAPSITPASW